MPTPSRNPPPDLPPRTHSSSCPDPDEVLLRSTSSSWRPDQDGLEMNVDSQESSSSPEPDSALSPAMAQGATHSRSTTESPRPESRNSNEPALSSDQSDGLSQTAYKPMDADDDTLVRSDVDGLAGTRPRGGYDVASLGADGEKLEYGVAPGRLQEYTYAPSMGFESNVRVRFAKNPFCSVIPRSNKVVANLGLR